jgi:hypothetical protein
MRPVNHLFVGGPPRSGTTLLELVLSAHPDVTVTPEAEFIERLVTFRWPSQRALTAAEADVVRKAMLEDQKLSAWPGFDRDEFLASGAVRPGMRLADVLDALFLWYARLHDGGTRWVGNKKGVYAEPSGVYFKKIFPDAKFVFIVRDPRDAVPSMIAQLGYSSARRAATQIALRGAHISRMCGRSPKDFCVVRYEDLVLHPLATCAGLCKFLELEPSSRMLEFYKTNKGGARLLANRKAIHGQTQSPLNPALVARWRQDSSADGARLAEIEETAASFMTRFGYDAELSPQGAAIRRIGRTAGIRLAASRAALRYRLREFLRRTGRS